MSDQVKQDSLSEIISLLTDDPPDYYKICDLMYHYDKNLTDYRNWWHFGTIIINTKNVTEKKKYLGSTAMAVSATSQNWYAGGFGVYIDEDVEYFGSLKLVIHSSKTDGGRLRIELYDDDNNNQVVDINKQTKQPDKDDVFIYDIALNWKGWKVITIPIKNFSDNNPESGDNIWNPSQLFGSAGLIQMQFIVMSGKNKSEIITFDIDTIKFNL